MAISVEPAPKNQPRRGLYIYNALAFSTLLSSQEADAHLRRNLRSPPGQPLNLTPEFLSCQLRFRKVAKATRRSLQTPRVTLRQPGGHCGHTRDLRKLIPWRLPGSRPAFRR